MEFRCFIGDFHGLHLIKYVSLNQTLPWLSGKPGSRGQVFRSFLVDLVSSPLMTKAMEDAIEAMNGIDLDGRSITVDKAQPQGSVVGTVDYDRGGRDRGPGDCFKCGKPGHFARECPSGDGARGDRFGGRDDRYGGRDDRYGGGGGGNSRYGGPDRNGDRYGGRAGMGVAVVAQEVIAIAVIGSGPYERPSGGGGSGYRS
ncbi:hypothetical protein J5N97_011985 [Dioscorea zingiberensis]|uniref:CCHC-type domain-containing protein n=1 Tax=Dioscorea zingiberensis TaxID=325984 RepID=A0A9D5CN94_9LILI|nr:hypothetical protein J5N97_011985 [Dioscorea zingiberensis]